jgi:hypothetical protein
VPDPHPPSSGNLEVDSYIFNLCVNHLWSIATSVFKRLSQFPFGNKISSRSNARHERWPYSTEVSSLRQLDRYIRDGLRAKIRHSNSCSLNAEPEFALFWWPLSVIGYCNDNGPSSGSVSICALQATGTYLPQEADSSHGKGKDGTDALEPVSDVRRIRNVRHTVKVEVGV